MAEKSMSIRAITDDVLLRLPNDGRKYELVDGAIRVSPAGGRHGAVAVALGAALFAFVKPRRLGRVFDSSTGFRMASGNVRSPDVSFVARHRLPEGRPPVGFLEIRPDLAIEILSPNDLASDIRERVAEYFAGGTRLMWVIDSEGQRATVYRSLTDARTIGATDILNGEDVVPGFQSVLSDLFE